MVTTPFQFSRQSGITRQSQRHQNDARRKARVHQATCRSLFYRERSESFPCAPTTTPTTRSMPKTRNAGARRNGNRRAWGRKNPCRRQRTWPTGSTGSFFGHFAPCAISGAFPWWSMARGHWNDRGHTPCDRGRGTGLCPWSTSAISRSMWRGHRAVTGVGRMGVA